MVIVTAIKPQKTFGRSKRVNIYLDGKFGFGLDLETFVKSGIKAEQELSEDQIERIIKEGEFQKVYENTLKFASLRPRSEHEIRDYFKRKKVHISLTDELLTRLKRLQLLDDRKFAVWWVEQRKIFKPKPKRVLFMELKSKGIEELLIKEVLEETELDELGAVKKLLTKNERKWKNLKGYDKKRKIFSYLMQRGFSSDTIKEALSVYEED